MEKKSEPSQEFKEKKELLLLERENLELKHKLRMEEYEKEKEVNSDHHQKELEKIRIKSAEIRKQQERKFVR